jgi:hypothetical protein
MEAAGSSGLEMEAAGSSETWFVSTNLHGVTFPKMVILNSEWGPVFHNAIRIPQGARGSVVGWGTMLQAGRSTRYRDSLARGWQPHRRLWAYCLENVGASTSHSPMGLHSL